MQCEMCGADKELVRAMVEGTEMKVCGNCAKYGRVLGNVAAVAKQKIKQYDIPKEMESEETEMLVSDFAEKIKKKREQLGLDQEQFSLKIQEKKSFVQKIETGELTPGINVAKKLERALGLKLVEIYGKEKKTASMSSGESGEGLTIGDLIKIKTRKSQ